MTDDNLGQGDPMADVLSILQKNESVITGYHDLFCVLAEATRIEPGQGPSTLTAVARRFVQALVDRGMPIDHYLTDHSLPHAADQIRTFYLALAGPLRQLRRQHWAAHDSKQGGDGA